MRRLFAAAAACFALIAAAAAQTVVLDQDGKPRPDIEVLDAQIDAQGVVRSFAWPGSGTPSAVVDVTGKRLTTLRLRLPVVAPPPEPAPAPAFGELAFDDDFTTMASLATLDTRQVTGGGTEPRLVDVGGMRALEASAPEGGKSEIGHVLRVPVRLGDVVTIERVFRYVRSGNSECFNDDVESSRAVGDDDSEPGPRMRRKNRSEGIEQDKFDGVNISPAAPVVEIGRWYFRRWQFRYGLTDGWHKVWLAPIEAGNENAPLVIDRAGLKTGPGTPLDRNRFGVTASGSGAGICTVQIRRQAMWIKRAG